MPFYATTASYNDTYNGSITLVIPAGMMLTGTLVIPFVGLAAGNLSGSLWGDGVTNAVSGSLVGLTSGSTTVTASNPSFYGGPTTASFTGSVRSTVTVTLAAGTVITSSFSFTTTQSVFTLLSGTLSGSSGQPLTGVLNGLATSTYSTVVTGTQNINATGSMTGSFFGSLSLTIPSNMVLYGTAIIPISGTFIGLVSGTVVASSPLSGTLAGTKVSASFFNPTLSGLREVFAGTNDVRARKTYSFMRQAPLATKFFIK
jgi:hypothetical protein